MKILFLILSIVLFSISMHSQAIKYRTTLDSLTLEGVRAIDKHQFEEAIEIFDKALKIDSTKWELHYEKALAYYQLKEFDSVIVILEPFIDHTEVNDNYYQVLGSSYDIKKELDKAGALYETGLKKFPSSGKLYMEYGLHCFETKDGLKARASWERGIEVDPGYENNYYLISKYEFHVSEFCWSIMYGETFMNISEIALRLDDMSQYINDSYLYGFYDDKDSLREEIGFTKINILSSNLYEYEGLPFEVAFNIVIKKAAQGILPIQSNKLTIDHLQRVRERFIDIWYKDKWNQKFSNPLFDLHRKLIEKGHFETYNYWIFNSIRKQESETWIRQNSQKLNDFGEFMAKHGMKIHKGNYFTRSKYTRDF